MYSKKVHNETEFSNVGYKKPVFSITPFNLSNADLYMIILPEAELFIYKRYFIGYKVATQYSYLITFTATL